jgi:hypothetical protein
MASSRARTESLGAWAAVVFAKMIDASSSEAVPA